MLPSAPMSSNHRKINPSISQVKVSLLYTWILFGIRQRLRPNLWTDVVKESWNVQDLVTVLIKVFLFETSKLVIHRQKCHLHRIYGTNKWTNVNICYRCLSSFSTIYTWRKKSSELLNHRIGKNVYEIESIAWIEALWVCSQKLVSVRIQVFLGDVRMSLYVCRRLWGRFGLHDAKQLDENIFISEYIRWE